MKPSKEQVVYFASDDVIGDYETFTEVYLYNTPEEAVEDWLESSYKEPPKYLYKATLERATVKKSEITVDWGTSDAS